MNAVCKADEKRGLLVKEVSTNISYIVLNKSNQIKKIPTFNI